MYRLSTPGFCRHTGITSWSRSPPATKARSFGRAHVVFESRPQPDAHTPKARATLVRLRTLFGHHHSR
jgi:hypothetical protein